MVSEGKEHALHLRTIEVRCPNNVEEELLLFQLE